MAALLALAAAAAYGAGDFLGGLATKRAPATAVVLWSHVVGLLALLFVVPLIDGELTTRGVVVGGLAGILGATGVALLFQGLSVGPMSVVAPITALLSAIVPVIAGLATGERPAPAAFAGIALALLAIGLVSKEEPETASSANPGHVRARAVALALGAGLGFGLFFVGLDAAGDGGGIWPVLGARVASVGMFSLLGMARITAASPPLTAAAPAIGSGLLDVGANICYILALTHGMLSLVAVLAALYPAGTVLLARYVLGERTTSTQQAGLGLAGVATILIAAT